LTPTALHLFFLLYAINCAVFYQDRMILDTVKLLAWKLLAQDALFVEHGRAFIQLPPQILPWLAMKIGLPLKGVALAYSLGFCLYHYLMALLLYYGFRRRDLATLLVLVILIHLAHNNFYIIADGMHIIPWALCMLAVLQYPTRSLSGRVLVALGAVVFAVITASSHLFGLPLSLALGGYAFFISDRRKRLLPALAVTVVGLMVFYAWHRAGMNEYEREKMGRIGLEMLRGNGRAFALYFVFAHAGALAGAALLGSMGLFHTAHRGACFFSALCVLGYATLIAAYVPINEGFIHLYYWHCMMPMYAIVGTPFFDAHCAVPIMRVLSRPLLAGGLAWSVVGSASDLSALRERSAFQTHLCGALAENGQGRFIVEDKQLSRDPAKKFPRGFLLDETGIRTSYTDPAKATLLISQATHAAEYWAFAANEGGAPSRYLPWHPAKQEAFVPAIVPAPRAEILRQAGCISLDYPENPTYMRVIDGWLSNYLRPPKVVYSVPVAVTNRGVTPFPACDTERTPVMFGYYWQRGGTILFEDLNAEYLPVNVKTTFQHTLNVRRAGIPHDARLTVDLFLNGQPLLCPEAYYRLIPDDRNFTQKALFDGVITTQKGFYNPEKSGVWMARRARFTFTRDLRLCSFSLSPPPNVDVGHPADIEVRCEAAGMVIAHRFTDRTPFTVTVDAPKAGQTVVVTSTMSFCPARAGTSADTRRLALKMHGMNAVAP
jgi:hypothetical protein